MKPGDLVISLYDYRVFIKEGVVFTPFAPKEEDICTIKELDDDCLILEEVQAVFENKIISFNPKYWRKVDAISLDEVIELAKEAQENYSLVEKF